MTDARQWLASLSDAETQQVMELVTEHQENGGASAPSLGDMQMLTTATIRAFTDVLNLHMNAVREGASPEPSNKHVRAIVEGAWQGLEREVTFLNFLREVMVASGDEVSPEET